MQRLSKLLQATGLCSRRQAETLISDGRVMVNGEKITLKYASVVIDSNSKITLDGVPLPLQAIPQDNQTSSQSSSSSPASSKISVKSTQPQKLQTQTWFVERPRLWLAVKRSGELMADKDDEKKRPLLFNRLQGLIRAAQKAEKEDAIAAGMSSSSSSSSSSNKQTTQPTKLHSPHFNVFDLLKPVTRLEFTVEGLALFSNNGLISRILEASSLERVYRVRTHGLITPSKKEGLLKGLVIDGIKQPSMSLSVDRTRSTISWVNVKSSKSLSKKVLQKSFEKMHLKALRMIQVQFGPFKLSELVSDKEVRGGADFKEVEFHRIPNIQQLLQQRNMKQSPRLIRNSGNRRKVEVEAEEEDSTTSQ